MSFHPDTLCVQAGWQPKNGEPRVLPIVQSTTFKYDSSEHVGDLFDLKAPGHFYTRLSNPTAEAVENKIAALEGGVGALMTSSGQAAEMIAILNLCNSGDHLIASGAIYGGTTNLFSVTLKKLGIEVTYVDPYASDDTIQAAFRLTTRAVFGETIANPALTVFDIERFARVAHANGVPLIVDNTFPTAVLCRPFDFGADIVTYSTSKYLDGHAISLGGMIVDSGRFDWRASGKFPGLTEPDPSYHGTIYTDAFGPSAFIVKARVQLMRDLGATPSPMNAFLLNLGMETLHLRMERHCRNAEAVAAFLEGHPAVSWINYPGLPSSKDAALVKKYLPRGTCGVISFGVKGGRDAAVRFMDSLKLAAIVVHVADARTGVLHPASTTHRQLTDEQLTAAGISPELVRLSVGIENAADIIADLDQALSACG
ncbi:MAG: O-acetylhomoserine aminocarboxypropyltransferase/cysteine synthase [Kiritimatiellae bacterium]|jgi:O-acetylhomoserine (thiol)-lyase|nr:O-acetylhomoserine aminocarboxypropyltransferase/cysteine synthase [Kiritimatiellia bacterium]MDD2348856.1 O-acetylhomoserine aminocarboxypropyltransferase/cysteine synthase [Kiritimatiellia bacterium]HHU13873.1 O-acetylhomoserine aminocarboxypropyltransferase/cysteine synthase [Lentisphaerota bacterium]